MSWSILYLPAIDDAGQPLWPEMFPRERLDAIRRQMGGPLFACMYLGRPEALSGDIFKREWFRKCRLAAGEGGMAILTDSNEKLAFDEFLVFQYWDLAISEKQTADYTVCCTLALHTQTMRLFVLDIARGHWTFDQTQKQIARVGDFWSANAVGIEKIAYQAAAVQEAIRNTILPIVEVKVDRDKVTRARLPAALAENGKVWVCEGPWTDDFFDELLSFPGGKHDDQVDALSGACALAQNYVPSRFVLWGSDD